MNNATNSTSDPDADVDTDAASGGRALVETLVEGGVVSVDERTETVTTTIEFEDTYSVYLDTYRSVPQEAFVGSVGDVFGFESADVAARRIDELDVTREQFAAYLSLESFLDGSHTTEELSRMAVVVSNLDPETPVPEELAVLGEDSYEAFVADHDRAIVTVWKRRCDPCDAMKRDLDGILAAVPEDVPVAGIDGEEVPGFRREYGIEAAPAMVLFENGRFREGFAGRATPERVATACADVYDES